MDAQRLREAAQAWLAGNSSLNSFLDEFRRLAMHQWGSVSLDVDRAERCGFPEVVFGEGKRTEDILEIVGQSMDAGTPVLATRLHADSLASLSEHFPDGAANLVARTWRHPAVAEQSNGRVNVLSAGTTDQVVAEEALETLRWMGVNATLIQDVGVAGPHRLLAHVEALRACDAVVVVAGMEGALPSVVGGHVACPVIAVPTSVGYGAAFGGLAALLSMLNTCASNVSVVNIDAGFKGGYVAGVIASRAEQARRASTALRDSDVVGGGDG